MKNGFISYEDISCTGELAYRANANFTRLEGRKWRADTIHSGDLGGWPGDWEGRAILALTLLSQSTHRRAAFLDEIMERLPSMLNSQNYFGRLLDTGCIDEQQLSGNSWFLRAMCEYYTWKKDEFSLSVIKDIVRHLILPCKGHYAEYPLYSPVRQRTGDMAGTLFDGIDGSWKLSSDNGCAFIMIDGASHAYEILKDPALKDVLDEMIAKFLSADLLADEFQTHATLSATRGMIRLFEITGECSLLESSIAIYNLYKAHGMTENYANYNWFGRPDTWTEPCAIVDSLIVAMNLWKITEDPVYVKDASNILDNALGHAQRPNGGFGCDQCSGVSDLYIQSHVDAALDAYWCCSMRGGEGLSKSISYSAYTKEDILYFPVCNSAVMRFHIDGKEVTLSEASSLLSEDKLTFTVIGTEHAGPLQLRIFIPDGIEEDRISVTLNGAGVGHSIESGFLALSVHLTANDIITIHLPAAFRQVPVQTSQKFKDYITLRHGGLILGVKGDTEHTAAEVLEGIEYDANGRYINKRLKLTLEPINDLITMSTDEVRKSRRQILFKVK
ncbi:MAG: glycoside hydrolase family protein [Saccharofermentanales bacterium]